MARGKSKEQRAKGGQPGGSVGFSSNLGIRVIRKGDRRKKSLMEKIRGIIKNWWLSKSYRYQIQNRYNLSKLAFLRSIQDLGRRNFVMFIGSTYARVFRSNGTVEDIGCLSTHVVTDEFVQHLVDDLQLSDATFSDYKYHVSGTDPDTEPENADDNAASFGSPDPNPLTTGTQVEGASPNIYKTVATINYTGTKAVKEHGVLNNATLLSGKLLDRSVFSVINVENGDSIEFTYELTCTPGG